MAPFQGYGSFTVRYNPGLRFAPPWAIEYDPFGVEKQGQKTREKKLDDLFSWW
jgi:hypothetical protein